MSSADELSEDEQVKQLLSAAGLHENERLEKLLKEYKFKDCDAVDVQNAEGISPLHAAIASCEYRKLNGESTSEDVTTESAACDTVRLLLESGAIWNQLDKNGETPGCIAYRLSLYDLYELMVDAGVRAEIILNRLDGYERLNDAEDLESEPEQDRQDGAQDIEVEDVDDDEVPVLVESAALTTTTDVTSGLNNDVNSVEYLASNLVLTRDKLLDGQQNGVMMAWESDIMKQSADSLLTRPGMKILNIGAGMMIFDSFVQGHENKPDVHHIVEPHPDILTNMEEQGWDKKSGVTIHPGRWQEILPQLVAENQTFDAIYYDTFAESYSDFREFFTEYVLGLLEPDGKWSFFNGMGADRQISYDVYQKVAEIDLLEAGFDVEWHDMDIPELEAEWDGVKRKYWNIKQYRLPVCKFMD